MGSYNWNWPILLKEPYFGWIVSGFGSTLLIALLAWAIAFPLGSIIGVLRTVDNRALRFAATTYVEIFRNIPLLVQMFLWYFVVPELLPAEWGRWIKRDMPHPQFITAVMCLGLYTASRVAEQVRSGLEAIPRGQRNAGLAMGLTPAQVYRHVLVPVAFRTIIPPLTSDFLGVFKTFYGPVLKAFAALEPAKQEELHNDLHALIVRMNRAGNGSMVVPSEYLEVVITKR